MAMFTDAAIKQLFQKFPRVVRKLRYQDRLSAWQHTARSQQRQKVWGYADRHSIAPAESFQLMLSAGPVQQPAKGHLEIFRIGCEDGGDRRCVWCSEVLEVDPYEVMRAGRYSQLLDNTAAALGPGWAPTLSVKETGEWDSGYYSVDFVSQCGQRDTDIAFIVVTDVTRCGDVLVKLATATYQAYNTWGGHSLYDDDNDPSKTRGHMVSFDRPTRSEFYDWEYYYVLWLERLARKEGFSVAYATNHDLTTDSKLASGYKLLVSVGHDEYWSQEEYRSTRKRLYEDGGNMLFLGANQCYWRVRYAEINPTLDNRGRLLICYKSAEDPVCQNTSKFPHFLATQRFRETPDKAESVLMGVAYQSNLAERWAPGFDYRVAAADHPWFAGTGYKNGDNVVGLIGHEWDNRQPEATFAPPGEKRIAVPFASPAPVEEIQVLFNGAPVDLFGREGLAEAVTFTTAAGATVFSAGSIRWSWGLGKERFVQEPFCLFNRNLHLRLLA